MIANWKWLKNWSGREQGAKQIINKQKRQNSNSIRSSIELFIFNVKKLFHSPSSSYPTASLLSSSPSSSLPPSPPLCRYCCCRRCRWTEANGSVRSLASTYLQWLFILSQSYYRLYNFWLRFSIIVIARTCAHKLFSIYLELWSHLMFARMCAAACTCCLTMYISYMLFTACDFFVIFRYFSLPIALSLLLCTMYNSLRLAIIVVIFFLGSLFVILVCFFRSFSLVGSFDFLHLT